MKTNGSEKAKTTSKYRFVLFVWLVLLLGACTSQTSAPSPPPATATPVPPTSAATPTDATTPIQPDYWPTEGWRTSTPEEQGLDSEQLAELIDYLQEQKGFDIHSLLIIRNGYVVTDAYFYPFAEGYLHNLASATKSFTSTLIGIAIDQGAVKSVEQPVLDFFPERTVANLDANKEAMTLEDLLAMRSGFECNNQPAEIALSQMMASSDWAQFALDLPMAAEPGTRYAYCSPNSHLLSAIIQEITGMSTLAFAQQHLFGPLGVSDVIWPADPQGNNWGWGDLKLAPHDMAKLGYLFLNEGRWDGQQVVSSAWVKTATSGASYGYQWWLKPSGFYYATGVGGQEIWVLPDRDMVVVMTGASGGGGAGAWGDGLMNSRIVPLAESAAPLPLNPDGVATLESKIQAAAAPVQIQPEPVQPMPEIARQVAGQTFVLDSNQVGVQSMSLDFPEEAEAVLGMSLVDGNQIEWLIGLDNVLRFFPGNNGLRAAAKGRWESGNVFVIDHEEIGGYARERISAAFEGDQITIQIQDLNRPDAVLTLVGRLEE